MNKEIQQKMDKISSPFPYASQFLRNYTDDLTLKVQKISNSGDFKETFCCTLPYSNVNSVTIVMISRISNWKIFLNYIV